MYKLQGKSHNYVHNMKRKVIINNKHSIYELPHDLPNDFRLRILGNFEKSGKSSNSIELQPSAQSSSQNEFFVNISKQLLKKRKLRFSCSARFHIKTRVCLKLFVNGCLCKLFFASNLPQTPSNLIFFYNFCNSKAFGKVSTQN